MYLRVSKGFKILGGKKSFFGAECEMPRMPPAATTVCGYLALCFDFYMVGTSIAPLRE